MTSTAPTARLAAPAATRPSDWCGTPVPGRPRPGVLPFGAFTANLSGARTQVAAAASSLQPDPTMVARLESPRSAALRSAEAGLRLLDSALAEHAPEGALHAARQARTELVGGIRVLNSRLPHVEQRAQRAFTASVNWMNVAENYVRTTPVDPTLDVMP